MRFCECLACSVNLCWTTTQQTNITETYKDRNYVQEDAVVTSKLRSAAGLSMLKTKKYKAAAQKFTEVRERRFLHNTSHPCTRAAQPVPCRGINPVPAIAINYMSAA